MRRLENDDEDKFWEAWIKDDLIFCYRFGKIGAAGHLKIKKFKTHAEAEAELEEKLQEKLREGFAEPGAPEPAGTGEDEESGEEDGEKDEVEAEAEEPEDAAEEEEEEVEEEAEEEEEEEDRPKRAAKKARARAVAPPEPPPEPEKPKLPARVRRGAPSRDDLARAAGALEALAKAAGGRSWHVKRRANAAGRAMEKLGGGDPGVFAETSRAWGDVVALVIAPAKALPLHAVLRMLWAVDGAVIGKTVALWRAKMLSSPASAAVGVLASTFDAIPDAELAAQTSAALVDRALPRDGFKRRFARVVPFLEESLKKKGSTVESFLSGLRPEKDAVLQRRLADAKDVARDVRHDPGKGAS